MNVEQKVYSYEKYKDNKNCQHINTCFKIWNMKGNN